MCGLYIYCNRRYAEFVASIFAMQGSSSALMTGGLSNSSGDGSGEMGIGGGGELMLQHDLTQLRVEMISKFSSDTIVYFVIVTVA